MKYIKLELKWAFIFAGMTLVWMILERLFGLHDKHIAQHPTYSNFIMLPAILVYVFALLDKKRNFYNGRMNYKQGFICGLIITLFVTILSPITQLITSIWITPHYFENAIRYSVDKGLMTQESANEYFTLGNYILQSVMFAPIAGVLTTVIVAFFTKSKSNN